MLTRRAVLKCELVVAGAALLPSKAIWGYHSLLPGPTFRVSQVTQAMHREVQAQSCSYASTITLQRYFKSIRFEHKDLWAWKSPLSSVAYDRKEEESA